MDRTREQEVERVLALGASQLVDRRGPEGSGRIMLADPEGTSSAYAAFVHEADAAAELDPPVIIDVNAVMVIQARAPDLEVVAGLESAAHATPRTREPELPA